MGKEVLIAAIKSLPDKPSFRHIAIYILFLGFASITNEYLDTHKLTVVKIEEENKNV